MKQIMLTDDEQQKAAIHEAGEVLRRGGVIVYPTDTLYGLGGLINSDLALQRIYALKGRPGYMPLPVIIAELEELSGLASSVPEEAWLLMQEFWPGALTIILPALHGLSPLLLGGGTSVGVRMPDKEVCRGLVRCAGGPIVSTSANRSGEVPVTAVRELSSEFIESVDLVIDGGSTMSGESSAVVDCAQGIPTLLRAGTIDADKLRKVVPNLQVR